MSFTYNISFEVAGVFVLTALLICTYFQYPQASRSYRAYQNLVATLLVGEIFDVVSAIANSLPEITPIALGMFLNIAYFAVSGLCQYLLVNYVRLYAKDDTFSRFMLRLDRVILVLYMVIVISNALTGWVFNYSTGEYTHGILYSSVYVIPCYFMVGALALIIHNRSNFTRRQMFSCFTFIAITALGMLFQVLVFPGVLLTYFGASLAALVYLFALETPDYLNLTKTMADLDYLRRNLQKEVTQQTALAVERQHHLEEMSLQTVQALANAIDAKDEYTNGHSSRVAEYSVMVAKRLGWPDDRIDSLRYAAMLHDIGKIGIPDNILNKPGRLNEIEYKIIQTHTVVGGDILKTVESIPMIRDIALSHHERWDGKGYPNGLKGEEIPEEARVVEIADAYDAMSSDRVYRLALSKERVREELITNRETQFDPTILDLFVSMLDEGCFAGMRGQATLQENALHTALLGTKHDPATLVTLDEIVQAINSEEFSGPTHASDEALSSYYEYFARSSMRESNNLSVVMIRVTANGDHEPTDVTMENAMACMDMAIRQTIRSADFYTRLNSRQYSIVLVELDAEEAERVIDRIVKGFYRFYEQNDVRPIHEYQEIASL